MERARGRLHGPVLHQSPGRLANMDHEAVRGSNIDLPIRVQPSLLDLESDAAGHAALLASLRLYADLGGRGNESRADDAERTGYGSQKKFRKSEKHSTDTRTTTNRTTTIQGSSSKTTLHSTTVYTTSADGLVQRLVDISWKSSEDFLARPNESL